MTSRISHLTTLGLPSNATDGQIRRAYKTLSLRYHPDKHNGSQLHVPKLLAVQRAYEALLIPQNAHQSRTTAEWGDAVWAQPPPTETEAFPSWVYALDEADRKFRECECERCQGEKAENAEALKIAADVFAQRASAERTLVPSSRNFDVTGAPIARRRRGNAVSAAAQVAVNESEADRVVQVQRRLSAIVAAQEAAEAAQMDGKQLGRKSSWRRRAASVARSVFRKHSEQR